MPNNCFNLIIPFVMKIAVATLGNFHTNPFGPELQVKQMLACRRFAAQKERFNIRKECSSPSRSTMFEK
jgi:hypothetical protein